MVKWLRLFSVLLALVTGAAPAAYAQREGAFALGANVSTREPVDGAADSGMGIGLLWRVGHSKNGWGWTGGLNWFATDLNRSIGGHDTELGELRVRPFMAGYGYTHLVGPAALSAGVLGGYAFTSFHLAQTAVDAYHDRLGARSVSADVSNTWVAKPEVGVWIDLNRKVGLNLNAGYLIARPTMTVSSSLGDDVRRLRADMFIITIGAVYSIF